MTMTIRKFTTKLFFALLTLIVLSGCNNTELETTIEEQYDRIAELEGQLEEQVQLNFEQQAEIELLTYRPEWQEIIIQDLRENISELLIEAEMCQAHLRESSEVPTISTHGEPGILFGRNGNVVVEVGGSHATNLSYVLLRWKIEEASTEVSPEHRVDWEWVTDVTWEVIGCFYIGGGVELIQPEEAGLLLQPAGGRLERLATGFFQVTDDTQLGMARRTDGDDFEGYFNLDTFDFYHKSYTSGPDGTTVVFIPNTSLTGFRFFTIGVAESIGEDGQVHFVAGATLDSFDPLSPEKPFVVTFRNRGSFPSYAFSFEDDHGVTRYFSLGEDMQDGGFIVGELKLVENQKPTTFVTAQQIHEDMPEFTFYRSVGNKRENSNNVYDVSIRIEYDGQVIQEIDGLSQTLGGPSGIESFSDPEFDIRFLDLTGNGYLDMTMRKTWGGTMRNEPHYFWLWDREAEKFVMHETLIHLSWGGMVTLNNHNAQGHISVFTRATGTHYGWIFYDYIDGDFVPVASRIHDLNEDGVPIIIITDDILQTEKIIYADSENE